MRFFMVVALLLLGGCASIASGHDQTISVNTNPPGADCAFNREGRIIGRVNPTPGALVVEKSKHDMTITCEKEGYQEASFMNESEIESATWGNIILGGGIGWAIDSASGADNHYTEQVNISLVPEQPENYTSAIEGLNGRWIGVNSNDGCGNSWKITLQVNEPDVDGELTIADHKYQVAGKAQEDEEPNIQAIAALENEAEAAEAPEIIRLQLNVKGSTARGQYALRSDGPNSCSATIELQHFGGVPAS